MQETRVQSLGQEDLLEKEMAAHSSLLAWRIPCTEEPGWLQFMGLQRVRYDHNSTFRLWIFFSQHPLDTLAPVYILTMNKNAMGLLFFLQLFLNQLFIWMGNTHTQHKMHKVSSERVWGDRRVFLLPFTQSPARGNHHHQSLFQF